MIRYRIIETTEWARLKPIFEAHGTPMPSAMLSTAAIAENDDGEIIGMLTLQPLIHAEPLWVDPRYRGMMVVRGMFRQAEKLLARFPGSRISAFTENGTAAALAQMAGFEKQPYTVFRKDF